MCSGRARCTHVNELNSQAQTRERGRAWGPLLIIALITLLAHANAFHDALVLDDKVFVGPHREAPLNSLGEAFERDVLDRWTSGTPVASTRSTAPPSVAVWRGRGSSATATAW